ncbi:uncharacterized protein SPPG_06179 [Spizellomyces punctatus DAOM BR117]|uniref:ER membrane protein complex subunit 7 beta-sandwich domain-containing protein n=1 Tax=Spizellomyces punctatus (strain DAOM BR117) TaxID=645134 RepID=A0A0L0HCI9_SPIPD|nr:uncharacterized protein SPPG_06179 [Spizellomyces punctatus DAOM BR117]KNC98478.1 hypothetical protein SPPG_06179 [Spizellomyces punctatus DAOM BR117]|eukprot:XP_016606518.1 hypothetical protein SPPG_06179 [Spizellomyces punctatus DAOM BR117]
MADVHLLGPNVKVWINGGQLVAYVEEDGSFTLPDVPEGTHLLEVASHLYHFDKIRLDVSPTAVMASITYSGMGWSKLGPLVLTPLALSPRGKYDFFVPREGFNPMSLLSNPMILMSGFSLLMFFALPKLMSNMPEEAVQQMQERQQQPPAMQMPDVSQSLANWFAPQQQQPKSGQAARGQKKH